MKALINPVAAGNASSNFVPSSLSPTATVGEGGGRLAANPTSAPAPLYARSAAATTTTLVNPAAAVKMEVPTAAATANNNNGGGGGVLARSTTLLIPAPTPIHPLSASATTTTRDR